MKKYWPIILVLLFTIRTVTASSEVSKYVETPYLLPKVVFDFYYNEPLDAQAALYWVRSLVNPLGESPYHYKLDEMSIIVVIHGTEVVTVARKNYEKYKDIVERMRYYASFGVKFKVCGLNADDYGYDSDDFHEFIEVVPTAIAELTHWQQKGYALIRPTVLKKKYSIGEIR